VINWPVVVLYTFYNKQGAWSIGLFSLWSTWSWWMHLCILSVFKCVGGNQLEVDQLEVDGCICVFWWYLKKWKHINYFTKQGYKIDYLHKTRQTLQYIVRESDNAKSDESTNPWFKVCGLWIVVCGLWSVVWVCPLCPWVCPAVSWVSLGCGCAPPCPWVCPAYIYIYIWSVSISAQRSLSARRLFEFIATPEVLYRVRL